MCLLPPFSQTPPETEDSITLILSLLNSCQEHHHCTPTFGASEGQKEAPNNNQRTERRLIPLAAVRGKSPGFAIIQSPSPKTFQAVPKGHLVVHENLASSNPTAGTSSSSLGGSFYHRRRRSSTSNTPQGLNLQGAKLLEPDGRGGHRGALSPIPGTPNIPMSLSRSPSPVPGGGWASPGLNNDPGSANGYRVNGGASAVTWESAKAKSDGINGYPSFSTQNNGFFNRHYRKISSNLPHFNLGAEQSFAEKEKLVRGRWMAWDSVRIARVKSFARRVKQRLGRAGVVLFVLLIFSFLYMMFYVTRELPPSPYQILLTPQSTSPTMAKIETPRWRKEVCCCSCGESGRRCHGVEGTERMGH